MSRDAIYNRLANILRRAGLDPETVTPSQITRLVQRFGMSSSDEAACNRLFCPDAVLPSRALKQPASEEDDYFDPKRPWPFTDFERWIIDRWNKCVLA